MLTSQQLNALSRAFRAGKGMTACEAERLAAELPGGAQQLEARVTLAGFYRGGERRPRAAEALSRQVAWLRDAWLAELSIETRDPAAAEHALSFLQEIDPDLALSGLDRARGLMPDSRWWRARGDLLLARKRFGKPDPDTIAREAHVAYEKAWRGWLTEMKRSRKQFESESDTARRERLLHALDLSAPFTRVRLLTHLLEAAFEAELLAEAEHHAADLGPLLDGPVSSIAAEARHRVATAHGRLALRRKDEDTAVAKLMESTAPLAQALLLRYAGPDLKLAEELLAWGHRASVVEFLERADEACGGLCPRLTQIRHALEHGEEPDWTPLHAGR